jgi:hypothetical protein
LRSKGSGDGDPLSLAAREDRRRQGKVFSAEPDCLHQIQRATPDDGPVDHTDRAVGASQDLGDRQAGIEGAERILIDHLESRSVRAPLPLRNAGPRPSHDGDAASVRFEEAHEDVGDGRLARARLADEAERLAAPDRKADVGEDWPWSPVRVAVVLRDILNHDGGGRCRRGFERRTVLGT